MDIHNISDRVAETCEDCDLKRLLWEPFCVELSINYKSKGEYGTEFVYLSILCYNLFVRLHVLNLVVFRGYDNL